MNKVEKQPQLFFSSLCRGARRGSKPSVHRTALKRFYFTFHYYSFSGNLCLEGARAVLQFVLLYSQLCGCCFCFVLGFFSTHFWDVYFCAAIQPFQKFPKHSDCCYAPHSTATPLKCFCAHYITLSAFCQQDHSLTTNAENIFVIRKYSKYLLH